MFIPAHFLRPLVWQPPLPHVATTGWLMCAVSSEGRSSWSWVDVVALLPSPLCCAGLWLPTSQWMQKPRLTPADATSLTCPGVSHTEESWFCKVDCAIILGLFCLFQLSQLYPEENLEKFIPCLAGPDSFYVERNHMDLEADLR